MHDLHDLAFAAGEMEVARVFHGVSTVWANFFAHGEYIRLYGEMSTEVPQTTESVT
jgi:hypothetical protein